MYKILFIISIIHILSFSSVFALSDLEYKHLLQSSTEFRKADAELGAIWKRIFPPLSGEYRKQVLNEQREWVKHGRDRDATIFMDSGMNKEEAYTKSIIKRINVLRAIEYNANLSEEDAAAGRARADDYYNAE